MKQNKSLELTKILKFHAPELITEWVKEQAIVSPRTDSASQSELRHEAGEFLELFREACESGDCTDASGPEWAKLRNMLAEFSRGRARQGYGPAETAAFIFSLKKPLFARLRQELGNDAEKLADETWGATLLLDRLGLYTTEAYLKGREEVIRRQQQELVELSTPVVRLWTGVLALPLIGTLDSARTQVVMESLLRAVVETESQIAIIDITGVPTVDTLVAQHLLKTVAAARLMGAECIISGIRPQIAQTIVHLGVDLGDVVTKATLADAFRLALSKSRLQVTEMTSPQAPANGF